MKTGYWISGVVAAVIGVGAVGVAIANQGGHGPRGKMPVSFAELDANGDGKITQEEMELRKRERFETADTNGDGMLSKDEAMVRANAEMAKRMEDRIGRFIEKRDSNGDGMVSYDEISTGKGGDRLFSRVDADDDGVITKEEFAAAKAHRGWHQRGESTSE